MPLFELDDIVAEYKRITKSLVKIRDLTVAQGYDEGPEDESPRVEEIHEATLISSAVADVDGDPTGKHKVLVDLDVPAMLIPSSKEGHSHLIIDKKVSWEQYLQILDALKSAGIVEEGYVGASAQRRNAHLRTPWSLKADAVITPDRRSWAARFLEKISPEVKVPF